MPKLFHLASAAIEHAGKTLRTVGYQVTSETWQGVALPAPMLETLFHSFQMMMPWDAEAMRREIRPNLPWADDHFAERVSGITHNPPPSAAWWPFNPKSEEFRKEDVYTHTYPERMWCRAFEADERVMEGRAGETPFGLRYEYGDLGNVVDLLVREPSTRQAFLPIWFPEDTGVMHGGRVPCTLGYHFIQRHGYLHVTYYIRSCDFFRHFRDDVYMACRLAEWVLEEARRRSRGEGPEPVWDKTTLGLLVMHIGSLHCWAGEKGLLP